MGLGAVKPRHHRLLRSLRDDLAVGGGFDQGVLQPHVVGGQRSIIDHGHQHLGLSSIGGGSSHGQGGGGVISAEFSGLQRGKERRQGIAAPGALHGIHEVLGPLIQLQLAGHHRRQPHVGLLAAHLLQEEVQVFIHRLI